LDGSVTVANTTFSHSSVVWGTGGAAGGTAGDVAGGAIYTYQMSGTAAITLSNTILANTGGSSSVDCYNNSGALASSGHNLAESPGNCTFGGTGDQPGQDPNLAALADNGGNTATHALQAGSRCIDQGSCSGATADQRDYPRPVDIPSVSNADDGCDIGAYELQLPSLSMIKSVDDGSPQLGQRITYTLSISNSGLGDATTGLLYDDLPGGLAFAGPVTLDPGAAGTPGTPPILSSNLTVGAGGRVTVTLPVTVNTGIAGGLRITNTATVTSSQHPAAVSASVAIVCSGSGDESVTVDAATAGTLAYTGTQGAISVTTTIEVPQGAVTQDTTLIYTEVATVTTLPSGFAFAGRAFTLDAYQGGVLQPGLAFSVPVTITLTYDPDNLGGVPEDSLELSFWDGSGWSTDGITIIERDTANDRLTVTIEHLTDFALLGRYSQLYLPLILRQ
jgi:uncharacterized repeat protein (TIGR01451 family)